MMAMLLRTFAHDLLQLSNDAVAVIFDDIVVAAKVAAQIVSANDPHSSTAEGSQCRNDTRRAM
jgi:hypothetical protein